MEFQRRIDLIEKLQGLEQKYQVELWELNHVKIWPLIKKLIFFNSFNNDNSSKKVNSIKVNKSKLFVNINKTFGLILKIGFSYIKRLTTRIPHTDIVFSGASNYRINYKDNSLNRYFDPILDSLSKDNLLSGILTDYNSFPKSAIYKKFRVINLTIFYHSFLKFRNLKSEWDYLVKSNSEFDNFLIDIESLEIIKASRLREQLTSSLNKILNWKSLFKWVLRKSKARLAFGLCYYNTQMYGMNLAANELGIQSIDMQHGGQGPLHVAYNINKHPLKGYDLLPAVFWVWDEFSANQLTKYFNNSNYKIIRGGNPSMSLYNDDLSLVDNQNDKPNILITLQPLDEFLPEYIYRVIRNTLERYNWWIRLHPRMKDYQIKKLNQKLEYFNIYEEVKITEVSSFPLAKVLDKSDLHISKFSGTIIEAALVNVRSIIIDPVGIQSYTELINSGLAFGFSDDHNESFEKLIEDKLKSNAILKKEVLVDYKNTLYNIMKFKV
ncbi:hypothetical protein GCM10027429_28670 [Marivirga atlantica]|uniref:Uncharacterized protein n=1 Tax=Marivirga atlantica TaxID=1548457 RepID=A0A937A9R9_9BACT|nr:hypothetical protein [Marivirga atlantica]MBL0766447.1 hypothetical protein [Marivirga atlantica]